MTLSPSPTIAECLLFAAKLQGISDTPRLDIELLLQHVIKKDRTYLFTWPEHTISEEDYKAFQSLFAQRLAGKPIAHLTGSREFWSLSLGVNNSTLIPRPETELLVEQVLDLVMLEKAEVLDLGTGTGAIALALASEKSAWRFTGVDASSDAVALARKNLKELSFGHVQFFLSDWFENVTGKFDVIVSNPPYIDVENEHLSQGDVRFEPLSALVADNHGMADIEKIVSEAGDYLKECGWLFLEHGYDQGEAVREVLCLENFTNVETIRDLAGHDRVTYGRLQHG